MVASLNSKSHSPRKRGRRALGSRPMSEINVTPFVDVMLVLLIIFMVAAPLLTVGVPIELPKTAASALPSESESPLTISISADGTVQLQDEDIEPTDLVDKLRIIAAEREGNKIFLRADGQVRYELVAQVMGALNAAGFLDIGLVTDSGGPTLDSENSGESGESGANSDTSNSDN